MGNKFFLLLGDPPPPSATESPWFGENFNFEKYNFADCK